MGLFDKIKLNSKADTDLLSMIEIHEILMQLCFIWEAKQKDNYSDYTNFSFFLEEITPRLRAYLDDNKNLEILKIENDLATYQDKANEIYVIKNYQIMKLNAHPFIYRKYKEELIEGARTEWEQAFEDLSQKNYKALSKLWQLLEPIIEEFLNKVNSYYHDGISRKSYMKHILSFFKDNWQYRIKKDVIFFRGSLYRLSELAFLENKTTPLTARDFDYYKNKGEEVYYSEIANKVIDELVEKYALKTGYHPGFKGQDRTEFLKRNLSRENKALTEVLASEYEKRFETESLARLKEEYYRNKVIGEGVSVSFDAYVSNELKTIKNYTCDDVPDSLK